MRPGPWRSGAETTVLYFQFKLQAIPPLLAQAESLLAAEPELASTAMPGNIDILHTLLSFVSGDYPGTIESAQSALFRLGPGNAFIRGHLVSWCHMLGIACRPVAQEQVARVLLKLAQEHNLDVSTAWAHRHLGNSYYERDDLASAVHHFAQVVEHR